MNYDYGNRSDQVHPFFRTKKEWSKVKDRIVGSYVACYLKTVQYRGTPILIIDAFAGPGKFGDDTDGSPLLISQAAMKAPNMGVRIGCLFADAHPAHREVLKSHLGEYVKAGITEAPLASFSDALSRALEIGKGSTLFFYLDPYGIKDLEFEMVKQIYERKRTQSTEVLINFSFKTFMRMSGNWKYGESPQSVEEKIKQAKVDVLNAVMGGDYWVKIITNPALDKIQRENAVVDAYMSRIREYFEYTYSIPVKEVDEDSPGVPVDDLAKYHLVFGTRSRRAVVYMNDVANLALEPYFNQFKDGLLFAMTPDRYAPVSVNKIKGAIIAALSGKPMKRPEICEAIIPDFFLQYRSKDYKKFMTELVFKDGKLFANPTTLRVKGKLNDETLLSTTPWPIGGIS